MTSITTYLHMGDSHPIPFDTLLSPEETTRNVPAFNLIIGQADLSRDYIKEQVLEQIRSKSGANPASRKLLVSMHEQDWTPRLRAELQGCIPSSVVCTEIRLIRPYAYEKAYVYFRGEPLVGLPTYSSLAITLDRLFDASGNRDVGTRDLILNRMYNLHVLRFLPPNRSQRSSVRFMDALALILPDLDSSVKVSSPHEFLSNPEDQEEFNFLLRQRN